MGAGTLPTEKGVPVTPIQRLNEMDLATGEHFEPTHGVKRKEQP